MEAEMNIFFNKAWQQLYASRQGMNVDSVHFACEYGSVDYAFCRRPIEIHGKKFPYEDIVTPCAFSGPYLIPKESSSACNIKLAEAFNIFFTSIVTNKVLLRNIFSLIPGLRIMSRLREFMI